MKCEFCGADLSLEAKVCPHCGQINKDAQKHIRDMERYQGEFESTKKGVYSATKQYTEVTVRVIVIAVLVVVIALLWLLYSQAYDIRRNILRSDARRNKEEYSRILDQYLEEEDFRSFVDFIAQKGIDYYYSGGEYDQYTPLRNTVTYYLYVFEEIMDCASVSEGEEVNTKSLCNYLNYFYEYSDMERYTYYKNADRQENLDAFAVMENNIEQMLQVYCGLTEEEATSMRELSEARRTVLIEEKLEND